MSKLWTRLRQSDALVGVGLFVASIFLWTQTTGLRGNASLMPRIVLTGLVLCALLMIGQTLIAPPAPGRYFGD